MLLKEKDIVKGDNKKTSFNYESVWSIDLYITNISTSNINSLKENN